MTRADAVASDGLPDAAGDFLLTVARAAIADRLRVAEPGPKITALWDRRGTPDWAAAQGASFVTLTLAGRLRGCIGSLEAHRQLILDVRDNALAAAFRDPRFPPLTRAEYDRVRIEVSLLSPSEPLTFSDRPDALAQLRPGVDGLILTASGHRGTFLPQVWDELPTPDAFLDHLLRKAGLPASYWGPDVRLARYTVRKWKEPDRPASG